MRIKPCSLFYWKGIDMAYAGYLLKVGNYTVPISKIQAKSYKAVRTVIDLDSYRDAEGKLHRQALAHVPNKIEFNLIPMLNQDQVEEIIGSIAANYTVPAERKVRVTFYVPETNKYETQDMYMADVNFTMYGVFDKEIKYEAIRLAFISY